MHDIYYIAAIGDKNEAAATQLLWSKSAKAFVDAFAPRISATDRCWQNYDSAAAYARRHSIPVKHVISDPLLCVRVRPVHLPVK